MGPLAPLVIESCANTITDILVCNGSGVFEPDAKCKHLPNAKSYLLGFCIDLRVDHPFSTCNGIIHVESAGKYQAQFHWHDGEGRLTLDPVSSRIMDSSMRKSISHPLAYHGLPYMM